MEACASAFRPPVAHLMPFLDAVPELQQQLWKTNARMMTWGSSSSLRLWSNCHWRCSGQADAEGPYPINNAARARLVCEAYEMFRQDLTNIQQGVYKLPWDMTTLNHRPYNPLYALSK